MLRRLEVHGFKAFGEGAGGSVVLDAAPLTLLAGPNGAGKSTLLQSLDVLGMLVRGTISELLDAHGWVYKDLPHLLSDKQTFGFVVDVELGKRTLRWSLMLGTRRRPGIAREVVDVIGEKTPPLLDRAFRKISVYVESTGETVSHPPLTLTQSWLSTLDPKEDRGAHPGLLALREWAERIFPFWSLDPALLRAPSSGVASRVGPRGGNLASFLASLKRRNRDAFDAFVARVAAYYPRLQGIDIKSDASGKKTVSIQEAWDGAPVGFNANQVSDGLLRLLAVASIPDWEHTPSVVLLDEIENGLHPRLIGGIAELLSEISKTTQVIATTHSPITLNYVPAECTRLVTRGKGGAVTITNLKDTNGFAELREHFEPGELWYNVGEDRLVGLPSKGKKGRS
ncbi:MAG: AAA family ATPase [Myxococcales bacterium]|nr:AAA family ATPase [Myxococcales bacterium]